MASFLFHADCLLKDVALFLKRQTVAGGMFLKVIPSLSLERLRRSAGTGEV